MHLIVLKPIYRCTVVPLYRCTFEPDPVGTAWHLLNHEGHKGHTKSTKDLYYETTVYSEAK